MTNPYQMKTPVPVILILVWGTFRGSIPAAAPSESEDISVGFLPLEWVTSTLKKTLSPEGRYKFLSTSGPVRISDRGEKIDAARRALAELQHAPAIIPVEITFLTITSSVVQRAPVSPPADTSGSPVPSHFSPPRIVSGPGGGVVVIPSQPRFSKTRKAEPEATANAEVRQSKTSVARRLSASVAVGKAVSLPVLRQVSDAAALRALALSRGAIAESEPAWTVGGTELLVEAALSAGELLVKIVPQIVIPAAGAGQAARRIPLSACAASVPISRGTPTNTGTLPQTDAEFYRLFLGTKQAEKDTLIALKVGAVVQYVGGQPK